MCWVEYYFSRFARVRLKMDLTPVVQLALFPAAQSSQGQRSTGRWLWPRQPEEQLQHSHALHSNNKNNIRSKKLLKHSNHSNMLTFQQEKKTTLFLFCCCLTLGSNEALFLLSSSSTLWRISGVMFLASNVAMSSLTPRLAKKLQWKTDKPEMIKGAWWIL